MKIAITAESTIDLPKEVLSQYDIHIVPFAISLGDRTALDGDIMPEELFEYTDRTGNLPKTSAVNQFQYEDFFKKTFELGYDAIIHFSLSKGISSAYANACIAAESMKNVYVINTASLSTGIAVQAIYASELAAKGLDPETIVSKCTERIPACQASFSLESVNYLYKGGRCSALAMLGANLLKLKPDIFVKDGTMIAGKKHRGPMMKVVLEYVEETLSKFSNPDLRRVFITYSTAPDDVVEAVRDVLKKRGFEQIIPTHAGATISSYCGRHCLGILYYNDGPHPIE